MKGLNISIGTSSQHDSSNGWSSLITPDVAWRFNSHFSADATVPIYTYINVQQNKGTKARPVYVFANEKFTPGDAALNSHYETSFNLLDYNLTATLGLPSGSQDDGLGAGQVTYNFNNHFERAFGIISPDVEIGLGDSSQLVGDRVRKSYTAVGTLAHFQAGASIALTHNMNFEAEAYEELPLDAGTVYSTTGRGKKKVTTSAHTGGTEDNGFLNTLDIPLNGHVVVSGFYNRSLRSKIDTAGFSLTFLLRSPPADVVR
ncbi:hypothetical protein [Granulicella tundricola]|uniref:Uncharacterized protein n=1 Tax=Granulicella tundricola (strain ATCC BAA-1859 / DSM 23138 / MP5ACTX9) TaxID=1198114 RepID=E8X2V5_GRATM|nr:hypothetical protein [Granulicella tundricola]ADW68089.1 hypothetical protein AciX9_1026 [Granulicella tundricola MP5ACTX9]